MCPITTLFLAFNLALAAQECGPNAADSEQQASCEKQRAKEDASQKEYAEFEKNYPAYLAKKDLQRRADEWDEQLRQLKTSSDKDFCIRYGDAIRQVEPKVSTAEQNNDAKLLAIIKKQARLRKISFEDTNIRKQYLRLGMSKCMLYASWGRPIVEHQTTGSWGVHIQHVYGDSDTFVYTENGRITAWQD